MTQARKTTFLGWFLGLATTTLYLFTMEPDVSFWDCGEFIATSYGLEVGHPPGAPFYSLLAHVFTWLAMGNVGRIAWWSNALSAFSGGVTAMMLFWSLAIILRRSRYTLWGAAIGALCYVFCDTAWFSAVESEVYSLSMAISAIIVWAMLKWAVDEDRNHAGRWLLLIALLLGLGVCVHQLSLLTTPALLLIYIISKRKEWHQLLRILPLAVMLFVVGLSPYLILPIRANAGVPINEGNPYNVERFQRYVGRDRYEKAPLWPRRWRHHKNEDLYASTWAGKGGELQYWASYQLWYMYGRYLMWNFCGRYDDGLGTGAMQRGQFITGIAPIDKAIVGTSTNLPDSLPNAAHNRYFMLPLLLGLAGACMHYRHSKKGFWTVMVLFLMGGVVLNVYLNHPCYEPRERDYAYILSFYAFAIWIGVGAALFSERLAGKDDNRYRKALPLLLLAVPMLMVAQNWDDHDRSGRYIAADSAHNLLDSCNEGAILFTAGDNDTFPLWYAQHVEGYRTDVKVENILLMGGHMAMLRLIEKNDFERPVYVSHYGYNSVKDFLGCNLGLVGYAYRLMPEPCDSVLVEEAYRHAVDNLRWRKMEQVYVDEVSRRFLEQYWKDMLAIAEELARQGEQKKCLDVLDHALQVPLTKTQDPSIMWRNTKLRKACGDQSWKTVRKESMARLESQWSYYKTITPNRQQYVSYQMNPIAGALDSLSSL